MINQIVKDMAKTLLVVILCLSVIAVTCYKFTESEKFWDLFKSITTIIASVITVTIALLIFDQYGIKKTLKAKEFESVVKLLDGIQDIYFPISYLEGGCFYRPMDSMQLKQKVLRKYLLFPIESWHEYHSIKIAPLSTIWLPDNIRQILQRFEFDVFVPFDGGKDECAEISVEGKYTHVEDSVMIPEDMLTIEEFMRNWTLVVKEIKVWAQSYGLNELSDRISVPEISGKPESKGS